MKIFLHIFYRGKCRLATRHRMIGGFLIDCLVWLVIIEWPYRWDDRCYASIITVRTRSIGDVRWVGDKKGLVSPRLYPILHQIFGWRGAIFLNQNHYRIIRKTAISFFLRSLLFIKNRSPFPVILLFLDASTKLGALTCTKFPPFDAHAPSHVDLLQLTVRLKQKKHNYLFKPKPNLGLSKEYLVWYLGDNNLTGEERIDSDHFLTLEHFPSDLKSPILRWKTWIGFSSEQDEL